jgi:hypothetical protein
MFRFFRIAAPPLRFVYFQTIIPYSFVKFKVTSAGNSEFQAIF